MNGQDGLLVQRRHPLSSRFLLLVIASLVIAACVPEGIRLPQSPLLSSLERKSGLIAYVGTDGNIYTTNQAGDSPVAITQDSQTDPDSGALRFYDFPTWSPVENRLAYQGVTVSERGIEVAEIFTSTARGEDSVRIYDSSVDIPLYLYWSPDGNLVSFLTTNINGGLLDLQVAESTGGEVSLVDTGQPYYWAWSPDQRILAHVGGAADINPSGARLSLLEMGPNIGEIGYPLKPSYFQAPAFSPDGSLMLFAAYLDSGGQSLIVATRDGEVRNQLASFPGAVAFDWSPSGQHIAYVTSLRVGQGLLGRLTIVDLDDPDEPRVIETGADTVAAFFWSPNGEEVAYFVPTVFRSSSSDAAAPEGGEQAQDQLFLSVFIAEARTGETRELLSFRPTRAFLNILPFFDQYQRSTTLWSPDSKYLVLSALRPDGTPGIFVLPTSGQLSERFLVEGTLAFWSWR